MFKFCLVLMVIGWVGAFMLRKQFILSLLSMEFTMLGVFIGLLLCSSGLKGAMAVSMYLLVLGACEAALGLSLLVLMVRQAGSDLLSNLASVKC